MTDTLDFSGRTALVTGAASGIGAACARWLDRHGAAHLVLVDTDADGLAALDLTCSADRVTGSVADPDLWARLEAGWDRLDHAVVNAGIGGSGEIADLTLDEWRRVMSVNCDGAFLTLAASLRAMRKTGGSSAVFVTASVTGIKPVPGIGPYGVAKAGVAHMARIAAAENAKHSIRVNAIAPGGIDTAIWDSGEARDAVAKHGRDATLKTMAGTTPRGRFATPDEIAGEIGFLLSDMAANVTGHVWVSDGGYSF